MNKEKEMVEGENMFLAYKNLIRDIESKIDNGAHVWEIDNMISDIEQDIACSHTNGDITTEERQYLWNRLDTIPTFYK